MNFYNSQRKKSFFRAVALAVLYTFNVSMILAPSRSFAAPSQTILGLPEPGAMVDLTPSYVPVIAKGLKIHPENPILFDFIVDTGNSGLKPNSPELRLESEKLIKYFLASLTIPEDDLWVNLSPYEKNRIVPDQLGQTVMGKDMLAEDYILKQLTASLIYPEKGIGKEFWNKIYTKAQQLYGSSEIPVNTFNKVWIVAEKAKIYVHDNTAFVVGSHLKVMLEEDYLSLTKHPQKEPSSTHAIGSEIVREVVLPELEKEVNTGKNFANLRQIFNSMILAAWYKKNLKDALLNQVYSNKSKIDGVNVQDRNIKEKIYEQYINAYKKGVFNYVKEDSINGQPIARKYFSGGEELMRVFKSDGLEEVGSSDPAVRQLHPDGSMLAVQFQATQTGQVQDVSMNQVLAQQLLGKSIDLEGIKMALPLAQQRELEKQAQLITQPIPSDKIGVALEAQIFESSVGRPVPRTPFKGIILDENGFVDLFAQMAQSNMDAAKLIVNDVLGPLSADMFEKEVQLDSAMTQTPQEKTLREMFQNESSLVYELLGGQGGRLIAKGRALNDPGLVFQNFIDLLKRTDLDAEGKAAVILKWISNPKTDIRAFLNEEAPVVLDSAMTAKIDRSLVKVQEQWAKLGLKDLLTKMLIAQGGLKSPFGLATVHTRNFIQFGQKAEIQQELKKQIKNLLTSNKIGRLILDGEIAGASDQGDYVVDARSLDNVQNLIIGKATGTSITVYKRENGKLKIVTTLDIQWGSSVRVIVTTDEGAFDYKLAENGKLEPISKDGIQMENNGSFISLGDNTVTWPAAMRAFAQERLSKVNTKERHSGSHVVDAYFMMSKVGLMTGWVTLSEAQAISYMMTRANGLAKIQTAQGLQDVSTMEINESDLLNNSQVYIYAGVKNLVEAAESFIETQSNKDIGISHQRIPEDTNIHTVQFKETLQEYLISKLKISPQLHISDKDRTKLEERVKNTVETIVDAFLDDIPLEALSHHRNEADIIQKLQAELRDGEKDIFFEKDNIRYIHSLQWILKHMPNQERPVGQNVSGDQQKLLDFVFNQILKYVMRLEVHAVVSEEDEDVIYGSGASRQMTDGLRIVGFLDPIDGSSQIKDAGSFGSIITLGFLRPGQSIEDGDFNPRTQLVASFDMSFGPNITLTLTNHSNDQEKAEVVQFALTRSADGTEEFRHELKYQNILEEENNQLHWEGLVPQADLNTVLLLARGGSLEKAKVVGHRQFVEGLEKRFGVMPIYSGALASEMKHILLAHHIDGKSVAGAIYFYPESKLRQAFEGIHYASTGAIMGAETIDGKQPLLNLPLAANGKSLSGQSMPYYSGSSWMTKLMMSWTYYIEKNMKEEGVELTNDNLNAHWKTFFELYIEKTTNLVHEISKSTSLPEEKVRKALLSFDSIDTNENYFPRLLEQNPQMVAAKLKLTNTDEAMITIERLLPQQIIDRFKLAYTDAVYFSVLIAKYLSDRILPVLGKNGIASAMLNKQARQNLLGVTDAKEIMSNQENIDAAKNVHMRILELKGGLGTSFIRLATLKRLLGRDKIADKGTDSYFENVSVEGFDAEGNKKQFSENISVAELKLLYYISLAQRGEYGEIEVRELVNDESKEAVEKFWNTVYLADRVDERIPANQKRTYRQIFSDPVKGIKGLIFNPDFIVQGVLPVVDAQTGNYLNDAPLRSPGGHAAFVSLTMDENAKNQKDLTVPRITVFTNGDGVNNMLPPAVAGWIVKNNVPITMVTTTKQLLDLKGGLITLLSNKDLPAGIKEKLSRFETLTMDEIADLQQSLYPYLLELAQAKAEKQQDLFQKMGITLGEKSAQFFNTNVHAQYHNVLDPFLAELQQIIGPEKFYEIIGPDLITNPKEKKLNGGVVNVIQLEGASGSALLAMNRFILTTTDPKIIELKKKYGIERLVRFVNFDEQLRSEVFTPEKYTWDHYLYAFTDLFAVDPLKGRLVFTPLEGRNTLPGFDLENPKSPDKFYEDLENDILAFGRNLSVKELDYLAIRGKVLIPNAILKKGVFIKNKSGQTVDLTQRKDLFSFQNDRLVLDNVYITIDTQGNVISKPVTNILESINEFEKDSAMSSELENNSVQASQETTLEEENSNLLSLAEEHIIEKIARARTAEDVQTLVGTSLTPAVQKAGLHQIKRLGELQKKEEAIQDSAMAKGGIDLNSKNLQIDDQGEIVNIKFDPALIDQFKQGNFSGLRPLILRISSIPNFINFLGIN